VPDGDDIVPSEIMANLPIPSSLDRRELEVREHVVDSTIGENEQALHAFGLFRTNHATQI